MSDRDSGEESLFLDIVGYSLRNMVVEFFIEGRELDFPISRISSELGNHRSTIYGCVKELMKQGIVIISRKIGTSTFYKINLNNGHSNQLVEIFDKAINERMLSMIRENKKSELLFDDEIKSYTDKAYRNHYILPRNKIGINTTVPCIMAA